MPIAEYKPDAKHPTNARLPKVQDDKYLGTVVDNKYKEIHSLTAFTEGYPLTIDYYGQILGQDNDVREIDPAQSGTYQQYTKICRLNIRVENPLSLDYNDDSGLSVVTGSANLIPNLIPNTYDYFTFITTRGRKGLFRITNVRRRSLQRDSLYNIEYNLIGYIDSSDAKILYDSLESKVSIKKYFHLDRLIEGYDPLLLEREHNAVVNLEQMYGRIVEYYTSTFYTREYQTLVVPGQPKAVYDKFVVDFLLKIVSIEESEMITYIKQLGSNNDRFMLQPQFWLAILYRDPIYVEQANKYMGLTNRSSFNTTHYVAGASMSAIDQYVYPIDTDQTVILPSDIPPKEAGPGLIDTYSANNKFYDNSKNIYPQVTGDIQIFKRVLSDFYYVLSKDFYTNSDNQCLLEKVTWDYINGSELNLKELSVIVNNFFSLARLEQFYYGPLIMTLIRAGNHEVYS